MVYRLSFTDTSILQLLLPSPVCNQWNVLLKLVNVQRKNTPELMNDGIWCELIVCVSRFLAKSPDSRNKFVFLPKQPLLELSPPVVTSLLGGPRADLWTVCSL